jgi:hypothetical protein
MKFYYLTHCFAFAITLGTSNVLRASARETQEPHKRLRRHLQDGDNGVDGGEVNGGNSGDSGEIRFSRKISFNNPSLTLEVEISRLFPLSSEDFPMSQALANILKISNCVSVVRPDDYESSQSVAEMVEVVGGTPTHAPQLEFWPLFREVVSYQITRRAKGGVEAMKAMYWLNLPALWQGLTVTQIGEAVHDEVCTCYSALWLLIC